MVMVKRLGGACTLLRIRGNATRSSRLKARLGSPVAGGDIPAATATVKTMARHAGEPRDSSRVVTACA